MSRRSCIKLGITGTRQVGDGGHLPRDESVRLDLRCVDNLLAIADQAPMRRTAKIVMAPTGVLTHVDENGAVQTMTPRFPRQRRAPLL